MLPISVIVALVVSLGIVLLVVRGARTLVSHGWGRVTLLFAILVLPLLTSLANLGYGFHESSRTRFCLSCHEMQKYGMSLFADNRYALSAVHYQNRLIDRDQSCYSCHKDYAMFGDVKAKMNGLRHVWVHYFRKIPDKIALYQPYSSRNCLHCHDDARRFVEAPPHQSVLSDLYSGKQSCLACHNLAHDKAAVEAHKLWQAE